MMKKAVRAVAALALCAFMCGCVPHTELNERAIVQALGIDHDGSQYKITFQYYNMSGAGSHTQVDPTKPNVLTAKGTGSSVYAALKDAEFNCGRELMLGSTQLIVIGREATKLNLADIMSFSSSYSESHPEVMIAAAEKTAEEVLAVKFTEGSLSTQKLTFMFRTAEKSGYISLPTMLDTFISLSGGRGSLCLPQLTVIDEGTDVTEDGKNVRINGGVLFRNGAAAAVADMTAMSGLALLSGEIGQTTVIADYGSKRVAVKIYGLDREITPTYSNGRLIFNVSLNCSGEYLDSLNGQPDSGVAREIEKQCAKELLLRMEAAAEALLKANSDALRLELLLKHSDYTSWLKISDRWELLFPESLFTFDVNANISRSGLE